MLVLTRKVGEKLHIGDNITVTVTMVKGNRVKIGIDAPADVRIVRGELQELEFEIQGHDDAPASNAAWSAPAPAGV
ncbi:MAG TPA: carbon storage regulator [Pirellulales bacterium]